MALDQSEIGTMTMWSPELSTAGPTYLAISRALEADVRSGRLREGQQLPTHRALAAAIGVNVGTVSRAYAEARRRGLISGEVGRGTFVRSSTGPVLAPHTEGVIELGVNVPLAEPAPDLRAALRALADRDDLSDVTDYREPAGSLRACAAGACWMKNNGVTATPDEIVVCNGSQHGILVALAALAGPGEGVLAESLTYPGFRAAARLLGLRVRGVAIDEHGLGPEALEAACVDRPRLLYCTPALQNPTAAVLPAERRVAIARIARAHDLAIVVDDVQAGMLAPSGPSLASLAPELTVTIGGVSKLLVAGLRTAFVAAAPERIARLAEMVWATTWVASPLGAELAAAWIEDGTADRTIAARREEMRVRERLAHQVLGGLALRTQPGAYHVWLELPPPLDAGAVATRLLRAGVVVTQAERFLAAPGPAPSALRISLSAPRDLATLRRGLEAIAGQVAARDAAPAPIRL
jgi:DNA-binding transcriptional MocR family regulator